MEEWDVKRIIEDYADAAERMKAAGLDGIELQANGHLLDQTWSPLTNTMDPPYGGSFENRIRFATELLQAVRDRVGPEMIIGIRNTADETLPGGVDKEEGIEMARRFIATGNIDYINVLRGHIETDAGLTDLIPVQGMRNSPHLDFAGEVRQATNFPTFHAGKILDVATARYAIASGKLDMVGMTRAHIADPHILKKIIAGQEERIRPCVGATYCLDRIYQGGMALCIHNPSTGREIEMPHEIAKASQRKRVVVIGAGPGGMEAARVAAERGHEVIVHEAANHPGGQVRLTARSERRREMISIIDWRYEECLRMGVIFKFNSYAEADTVLAEQPDVVVIATGGMPRTDVLEDGNDLVASTWDIISGDVKPGNNVLIYDDAGDHAGMQAAEIIAKSGAKLEIMTRDRSFAPEVMAMNLVPYMRTLQKLDTTFTVTWRLVSAKRTRNQITAVIGTDYDGTTKERLVDQIIVNHGTLPLDELYFELVPHSTNRGEVDYDDLIAGKPQSVTRNLDGRFELFRIGDAVSSRNTHAAIYDALRLMRNV
jgi:N-methyl-L-proline demethylase